MDAIQVTETGGPERLEFRDIPRPEPGAGQVLVRIEAIGVNFMDVYHRTGSYPLPLPFVPGAEAAGVVESVGEGVDEFKPGDRVAYAMVMGAYAELAAVPVDKLVPLPAGVDARTAAAALLQGMTAHYLTTSVHALAAGHSVLVHAAAGGVGGLLVQIAHRRGARIFATASTRKLSLVPAGAEAIIDYTVADFESEVMRLTGGSGVDVAYDSVGRTTFDKSLNCVGVRGVLALFGQSGGTVPPVDPSRLAKRGIFLTRPGLAHYTRTREELLWRAREVFADVAAGRLSIRIDRDLPLSQAAEAHRLLESRQTVGKLVLIPGS
jgi:NADPH2:quinone reductase